jgi:hypothetical protein
MSGWKEKAIETFKGHLKDVSHQAPELIPIGSSGYRLDAPGTTGVNEFNNGPYSLIEPLLPAGNPNRKNVTANDMNLERKATLILRVEVRRDLLTTVNPVTASGNPVRLYWSTNKLGRANSTTPSSKDHVIVPPTGTAYTAAHLKQASNITDAFVVKAYINKNGDQAVATDVDWSVPVELPDKVAGAANSSISAIATTAPGKDVYHASSLKGGGLFEP